MPVPVLSEMCADQKGPDAVRKQDRIPELSSTGSNWVCNDSIHIA